MQALSASVHSLVAESEMPLPLLVTPFERVMVVPPTAVMVVPSEMPPLAATVFPVTAATEISWPTSKAPVVVLTLVICLEAASSAASLSEAVAEADRVRVPAEAPTIVVPAGIAPPSLETS